MKERNNKKNNIFLKVLIVLAAIIVVIAGIAFGYIHSKLSQINYKEDKKENFEVEVNEGVDSEGYMNIALFGVDSRDNNYDNTRSDCIIIVSINCGMLPKMYNSPSKFIIVLFLTTAFAKSFVYVSIH